MNTSDASAVLRRYVSAVSAGDVNVVRELFDEAASWRIDAGDLPISGTWEGRDQIVDEFLATAMSHYEPGSVQLEITAMIAAGDQVALQWTSRARTVAGEPYENGCMAIFTVRDGRIQHVREYMDTLYASRVFGGAPTPS